MHTRHTTQKKCTFCFFTACCTLSLLLSLSYDDDRRRVIEVAAIAAALLVRGCQKTQRGRVSQRERKKGEKAFT